MKAKDTRSLRFDFVANYMAPGIRMNLLTLSDSQKRIIHEVRIRESAPVMLSLRGRCKTLHELTGREPYIVTQDDVRRTFEFVTGSSLHSVLDELKGGFITISGGHRVGICGKVIMDGHSIASIRDISSLNFRIAHEFSGCANDIMEYIAENGSIRNTLIVSPPSCGKTTMLRDIARQLSNGLPSLGFPGVRVGIVDERSEICASYRGVVQNDVGMRTDVLDACPKSLGITLMLRSMSPRVIITDELSEEADVAAVMRAHHTGVSVIASAHGDSLDAVKRKPLFRELFDNGVFGLMALLGQDPSPGSIVKLVRL